MKSCRNSSCEGEQWIAARRRRESEEGKNRDKRIVMVKLIIQGGKRKKRNNKNTRFRNHRKFRFSLLVKVLELFLRCPVLVLAYQQKV
jgi:hypothetical protein